MVLLPGTTNTSAGNQHVLYIDPKKLASFKNDIDFFTSYAF